MDPSLRKIQQLRERSNTEALFANMSREERAAIAIQRRWRGYIARKQAAAWKQMYRYREQVAKEILATEQKFVKALSLLRTHIIVPLRQAAAARSAIIRPEWIGDIFGNIESISSVWI